MPRRYRTAITREDPLTHWATQVVLNDLADAEEPIPLTQFVEKLDYGEPAVAGHCHRLESEGVLDVREDGLVITEAGEEHLADLDPGDLLG